MASFAAVRGLAAAVAPLPATKAVSIRPPHYRLLFVRENSYFIIGQ